MEREEMIEEMANDIPAEIKDPYQGSDITVLYSYQRRKQIAKCLVSQNYRKIPEGAVVLTKDEYDKLNRRIAFGVTYDEEKLKEFVNEAISNVQIQIDEVRKETARDILQTLWNWKDRETALTCDLYELAEKYGVEVEE